MDQVSQNIAVARSEGRLNEIKAKMSQPGLDKQSLANLVTQLEAMLADPSVPESIKHLISVLLSEVMQAASKAKDVVQINVPSIELTAEQQAAIKLYKETRKIVASAAEGIKALKESFNPEELEQSVKVIQSNIAVWEKEIDPVKKATQEKQVIDSFYNAMNQCADFYTQTSGCEKQVRAAEANVLALREMDLPQTDGEQVYSVASIEKEIMEARDALAGCTLMWSKQTYYCAIEVSSYVQVKSGKPKGATPRNVDNIAQAWRDICKRSEAERASMLEQLLCGLYAGQTAFVQSVLASQEVSEAGRTHS